MKKKIKAEYLPGGAKRQELLDKVPEYLLTTDWGSVWTTTHLEVDESRQID